MCRSSRKSSGRSRSRSVHPSNSKAIFFLREKSEGDHRSLHFTRYLTYEIHPFTETSQTSDRRSLEGRIGTPRVSRAKEGLLSGPPKRLKQRGGHPVVPARSCSRRERRTLRYRRLARENHARTYRVIRKEV